MTDNRDDSARDAHQESSSAEDEQSADSKESREPTRMQRLGAQALELSRKVLNVGVDGRGPWKGSIAVATEHLAQHGDAERAIQRLVSTHVRLTASSGFLTGLGGLITMPVLIPADFTALWLSQARLAGAIAHLRGYDVHSEEVRSVIMLSLIGSSATEALAKAGVAVGNKSAVAAISKVPGRVLIEINKKVGYRLITKAGTKGVVNLTRLAPIAGGVIGGSVNLVSTRAVGAYAKNNFPMVASWTPSSSGGDEADETIVDAVILEEHDVTRD